MPTSSRLVSRRLALRKGSALLGGSLLVLALTPQVASAHARSLPTSNVHVLSAEFSACVQEAGVVGQPRSVSQRRPTCFRSLQLALAAATSDGRYLSMSDRQAEALRVGRAQPFPVLPTGNYILGLDSIDTSHGGATLTWNSPTRCTSTRSFVNEFTGSVAGYNNEVSSAGNFAYSGCANWHHYDGFGQSGANIDCGYSTNQCDTYIGAAMNDRSSSLRWTV